MLKKNTHTRAKQLSAVSQNRTRRLDRLLHQVTTHIPITTSIDRSIEKSDTINQLISASLPVRSLHRTTKPRCRVARCCNTPQFMVPRRTMVVHRQADSIVTQLLRFWLYCIAYWMHSAGEGVGRALQRSCSIYNDKNTQNSRQLFYF